MTSWLSLKTDLRNAGADWVNQEVVVDQGLVLKTLIAENLRVQMCVTSPPYWGLRDYGMTRQIGLERTPDEYVTALVEVFRLVCDLLANQGTLWLNLGDCYATGASTVGECPGGGLQGDRWKGYRGTRPGLARLA